jgi:hypothetical protein
MDLDLQGSLRTGAFRERNVSASCHLAKRLAASLLFAGVLEHGKLPQGLVSGRAG